MELIDKAAVAIEIEKLKYNLCPDFYEYNYDAAKVELLEKIENFINTLEVKEVDLEKEIQEHINECLDIKFPTTDIKLIAKDVEFTARKFFELGMQQSKNHNNNEE